MSFDPSQPPPPAGVLGGDVSDGAVYIVGDDGLWHHIPNSDTFNAMGLVWNDINWVDPLPGSQGDDVSDQAPPPSQPPSQPPPPPPPPSQPPATSFQWGGQTWGAGDLYSFVGWLQAHGASFTVWAQEHPTAAGIFGINPNPDTVDPKSVGEALGAYIAAGDTPAEAAAAVAPLAQSQVNQGFDAPTGDALVTAAQDVQAAYQAAGGTAEQAAPPVATNGGASSAPATAELVSIVTTSTPEGGQAPQPLNKTFVDIQNTIYGADAETAKVKAAYNRITSIFASK